MKITKYSSVVTRDSRFVLEIGVLNEYEIAAYITLAPLSGKDETCLNL